MKLLDRLRYSKFRKPVQQEIITNGLVTGFETLATESALNSLKTTVEQLEAAVAALEASQGVEASPHYCMTLPPSPERIGYNVPQTETALAYGSCVPDDATDFCGILNGMIFFRSMSGYTTFFIRVRDVNSGQLLGSTSVCAFAADWHQTPYSVPIFKQSFGFLFDSVCPYLTIEASDANGYIHFTDADDFTHTLHLWFETVGGNLAQYLSQ
jgi:hypothetical protein